MLILRVKQNDPVTLMCACGNCTRVEVFEYLNKGHHGARIAFDAPPGVKIYRDDVMKRIEAERRGNQ